MVRFVGEVCDFCLTAGKVVPAIKSLHWDDDPDADALGLCEQHLIECGRGERQPRVECPFCGKSSKNERELQSHVSREHRAERDAQRNGAAISAVHQ